MRFLQFFGDMCLDVFSKMFADVTLFCLGTWAENAARILIKFVAGVHYYISITTN